MAKRMVTGILTVGTAQAGLARIEWDDGLKIDRTPADDEYSGDPVQVPGTVGSGRITMLAGDIASGHASGGAMTCQYKEITYAAGVESSATKTVSFTKVTLNAGGSTGGEGRGERRYAFEYATSSVA
jgi:hypothetical protein